MAINNTKTGYTYSTFSWRNISKYCNYRRNQGHSRNLAKKYGWGIVLYEALQSELLRELARD